MLSECDPPLSYDDHDGTVRYQRTQVHPEPEGSIQLLPPKGAEARQRAFEELTRLTEAFVSTLERELTKESSLRGVSTIDDVGSESAAEPAPAKRTLHGDGRGISCCDDSQPRARSESHCVISERSSIPAPKNTSGRAAAIIDEVSGVCYTKAVMPSSNAHRRDAQLLTKEGQWVRDLAAKPDQQTPTVLTEEDRRSPDALKSDSATLEPQNMLRLSTDLPKDRVESTPHERDDGNKANAAKTIGQPCTHVTVADVEAMGIAQQSTEAEPVWLTQAAKALHPSQMDQAARQRAKSLSISWADTASEVVPERLSMGVATTMLCVGAPSEEDAESLEDYLTTVHTGHVLMHEAISENICSVPRWSYSGTQERDDMALLFYRLDRFDSPPRLNDGDKVVSLNAKGVVLRERAKRAAFELTAPGASDAAKRTALKQLLKMHVITLIAMVGEGLYQTTENSASEARERHQLACGQLKALSD